MTNWNSVFATYQLLLYTVKPSFQIIKANAGERPQEYLSLVLNWLNYLQRKRVYLAMKGQYTEAHDIDSEINKVKQKNK